MTSSPIADVPMNKPSDRPPILSFLLLFIGLLFAALSLARLSSGPEPSEAPVASATASTATATATATTPDARASSGAPSTGTATPAR